MRATQSRPVRIVRRLLGILVNLAMVVVVLACLAWIVPSAFGYSRYVITGGSMEPTIHKGSVVFEKPVPVDDLGVGDVITYQPPAASGVTSLVTHQIVEIGPAEGGGVFFTTQGDANPKPDPWKFQLTAEDQPVVATSVPHVGWVFITLADPHRRMLLLGVPAGLIALFSLVQVLGALRPGRAGDPAEDRAGDPAADPADDTGTGTRVPELV